MTGAIKVNEPLELHAVTESHVTPLCQLICENKIWLQQLLNRPQFVRSEEDTRKTVQSNVMLRQRNYAKMFVVLKENGLIGVISFSHIKPLSKTAEIGYWLDKSRQGQGIISQALQASIHHYVQSGKFRRLMIKCRADNPQNNQVASRNGFILGGCLKQAEFLNGAYDDANLYARIIDS